MEQLAISFAKKLSNALNYDNEQEQVIAYGLIAMLQILFLFVLILVIGSIGGFVLEAILIFLGVGYLRRSTGGTHSNTMHGCNIISCISITLLSILSKYMLFPSLTFGAYLLIVIICYFICLCIVYKKAPVDSANKRITSNEKRARLRKQSFTTLIFYFSLIILFAFLSTNNIELRRISNSICLLTIWQCFTLTTIGSKILHRIDTMLS